MATDINSTTPTIWSNMSTINYSVMLTNNITSLANFNINIDLDLLQTVSPDVMLDFENLDTSPFNHSTSTAMFNGSDNLTTSGVEAVGKPRWLTAMLGLMAGVVSLVTILGNLIVLLAFTLERTIRQPTNYFLVSLAVSDLVIGVFSMPLYTQYLLLNYHWPLGPWLCGIWLSLDYTVCLTSQYNVFLITMDRFLSVKIPAKYRNWRTERKVNVMIAFTWIVPAMVFFTTIIGWQFFVGKRTVPYNECEVQFLKDSQFFFFMLTVGYYWIPLTIMCFLYGGIYRVALNLQKRSDAKNKKFRSAISPTSTCGTDEFSYMDTRSINNSTVGDSYDTSNLRASKKKGSLKKNVKTALPFPTGLVRLDTTSFTTQREETSRSSSPELCSDDESSDGATDLNLDLSAGLEERHKRKTKPKSALASSALTGGLVRNLHPEMFLIRSGEDGQTTSQPLAYRRLVSEKSEDVLSDGEQNNVYTTVRTDDEHSIDKSDNPDSVPLLEMDMELKDSEMDMELKDSVYETEDLDHGYRFIDEESLLGSINGKPGDMGSNMIGDVPIEENSNMCDTAAFIWKRNAESPPIATYDTDEDANAGTYDVIETGTTSPNTIPDLTNDSGNHSATMAEREVSFESHVDTSGGSSSGVGGDVGVVMVTNGSKPTSDSSGLLKNANNNDTKPMSTLSPNDAASPTDRHQNTAISALLRSLRPQNSKQRNRKSRSENRARKALRTISFILGAFILCWTPYHAIVALVWMWPHLLGDATFIICYEFSYWLCYLNSPINPFCYAFVNAQFRRTFLRIFRLDWHKT